MMRWTGSLCPEPRRSVSLPIFEDRPSPFCLEGRSLEFQPRQALYAEGGPADFVYQVARGCVCTFNSGEQGDRVVSGFVLRADIFGLECSGIHRSSAEAISACRLIQCERRRLAERLDDDPGFAARAWPFLLEQERAVTRRLLSISHAEGARRLLLFLQDLSDRTDGHDHVELPMSRYDIADYLGLSSETVSRIFTKLKLTGVISLERGAVTLLLRPGRRQLLN